MKAKYKDLEKEHDKLKKDQEDLEHQLEAKRIENANFNSLFEMWNPMIAEYNSYRKKKYKKLVNSNRDNSDEDDDLDYQLEDSDDDDSCESW